MSESVATELEKIEKKFQSKFLTLEGEEEESKQSQYFQNELASLKQALQEVCEKVVSTVREKFKSALNPYSSSMQTIAGINQKLKAIREELNRERVQEQPQLYLQELMVIDTQIEKVMADPQISERFKIMFDEEAALNLLVKHAIAVGGVRRPDSQEDQNLLLSTVGCIDVKTNHKAFWDNDFLPPQYAALFQLRTRLYICGGTEEYSGAEKECGTLYEIDTQGRYQLLNSMKKARSSLGLCGIDQELLALAGWNQGNLKDVEHFQILQNKWDMLPALHQGRQWPGCCILENRRCFCFCGGVGDERYINTIETMDIDNDPEWQVLPVDKRVKKNCMLVAAPLLGKIIVFGGHEDVALDMYIFSEEGELKKSLCELQNIPGSMTQHCFITQDGKIFTTGTQKESAFELSCFIGVKWVIL